MYVLLGGELQYMLRRRGLPATCSQDDIPAAFIVRHQQTRGYRRIGETQLLHATVGFRVGADCFPDDVGLARCDLRTEAE